MHSPDMVHKCPTCGNRSICLIEDGFCENEGVCDFCLKDRYMKSLYEEEKEW